MGKRVAIAGCVTFFACEVAVILKSTRDLVQGEYGDLHIMLTAYQGIVLIGSAVAVILFATGIQGDND